MNNYIKFHAQHATHIFGSNKTNLLIFKDQMSKYNQMLYMNLSSALVATSILVLGGMLPYSMAFLDHPGFASHVLMCLGLGSFGGSFWKKKEQKVE